jgi:hypothetical protein
MQSIDPKPIIMRKILQSGAAILNSLILTAVLIGFNYSVLAQAKSVASVKAAPVKKKMVKAPPAISVKIDTASINLSVNPADVVAGYQFSVVHLKFNIAGNTPKTNVPVKLVIEDYTTTAKPQFNKIPTSSNTFTTLIDKGLFPGMGTTGTIIIPVTLKLKDLTNEKGSAYIKIDGQAEFTKITFNKPIAPKLIPLITLLDSTTPVPLDTFKTNTAQQVQANLHLKLSKGFGRDTSITITVKPLQALQNIKFVDDGQNMVYTLKIDSDEWDNAKDTMVTKSIAFFVQQTALVTDTQYFVLRLKNGKEKHLIKLIPFKAKGKVSNIKLIQSGNAQIIHRGDVGITRDYTSTINSSIDTITVKVNLHGKYDPTHNQLVFAFIDSTNLSKHFKILENPIILTKDEWAQGGGDTTNVAHNANAKSKSNKTGQINKKKETASIVANAPESV